MALAVGSAPTLAFTIDSGSSDVTMSLDTTVRYNAIQRLERREKGLYSAANDESQRFADKGDLALSRLDIFSEFDLNVRNLVGARISAAAWYDTNFPNKVNRDKSLPAAQANFPGGRWPDQTERYYEGPSGEFMDVFGWANINIGSTTLNVKAGRFVWLPGEFLISNGSSFTYGMAPNDGLKTSLSPGASAKETGLPIGQLGLIWQLTPELTLMGQYVAEFRASRLDEGGTFFSAADGGNALHAPFLAAGVPRRDAREGDRGDVGVGIKWMPDMLKGDAVSFWYRKFDDKNPSWANQVFINGGVPEAHAVYAKDIELYGLTYNGGWGAWSIGAEVNYRKNMPLASTGQYSNLPIPGMSRDLSLYGARGNTWHALLSAVSTLNHNMLFDSGSLVMQLDYMRLDKVTDNKALFNGDMSDVAGRCENNEVLRGCGTRDALSAAVNFTPTWQQALPSVDISMPMLFMYGLKGNPAAANAGVLPKESWQFRIGARLEYLSGAYKHQFELTYGTRDGKKGKLPGAAVNSYSGLANFRDRDYINFTYSTAF
ncbi:MAG: DUF1302 domain-containing protein [Azonexus sp.]|nr:DUF1302 domain-containing protein [Azonexus sp.]